jgi:hypothetical protein
MSSSKVKSELVPTLSMEDSPVDQSSYNNSMKDALFYDNENHNDAYNLLYFGNHYFLYPNMFSNYYNIPFVETFSSNSSNLIEKRNFLDDDILPIDVNFESLAFYFDSVVDSNLPCDLQDKEIIFDEYFDLDGIESHSLQSGIHENLGSIDSYDFPLLSKNKYVFS